MPDVMTRQVVRLVKEKRPAGTYWFDLSELHRDREGVWLEGDPHTQWGAPHAYGTLPCRVVVLVVTGQPWVAWWVDDPHDPRLEIDVCLPVEEFEGGWRYVDLELDPALHARDQSVEIQDWEEYNAAVRPGAMTTEDANLATATAVLMQQALKSGTDHWQDLGWGLLRAVPQLWPRRHNPRRLVTLKVRPGPVAPAAWSVEGRCMEQAPA